MGHSTVDFTIIEPVLYPALIQCKFQMVLDSSVQLICGHLWHVTCNTIYLQTHRQASINIFKTERNQKIANRNV